MSTLQETASSGRLTEEGRFTTCETAVNIQEDKTPLHEGKGLQIHGPELDESHSSWQVYVPKDSNCLFLSVILGYLIPVKDHDREFQDRFRKLYGDFQNQRPGQGKENQSNQIDEKLKEVQALIQSYNPFSGATEIYGKLNELVLWLRRRADICNPDAWGSDNEISKISSQLECGFSVFSSIGKRDISDYGVPQIILFQDASISRYYGFKLERGIGDRYKQLADVNSLLPQFIGYFVAWFEAKLHGYDMILEGELKEGKFSGTLAELIGRGAGGASLGVLGTFLGGPINGKLGEELGGKITKFIWGIIDRKRQEEKAANAAKVVDYFQENRQGLVEGSFDIFQSFEMQFIRLTTDLGLKNATKVLARDAVNRAIGYYTQAKYADVYVSEAVLLGKSTSPIAHKLGKCKTAIVSKLPMNSNQIVYEYGSDKEQWTTASLYEKAGLVVHEKTSVDVTKYYIKKEGSRTEKYGYRRLLRRECLDKSKYELQKEDGLSKSRQFTDYRYVLDPAEKLESILKRIDLKKGLTEERVKEMLIEVKDNIIEEINALKQMQAGQDEMMIKKLTEIEDHFKNLMIDKYLEKFEESFKEIKKKLEKISNSIEEVRKENAENFQKLFRQVMEAIKTIKNQEESSDKFFWFDVKKPVSSFTGREKELSELHSLIQRSSESQVTSISGLGGIGKTELASGYIQKYSKEFYDNNVLWINGENEETLIESFRSLATEELRICTEDANGKEMNIKSVVKEVYKFFAKRKCLFIFDNVEKSKYLGEFLACSLPPDANKPYILITSQDREWESGIKVMDLGVLELEDSIKLVKKGLKISEEDTSQDQEIENLVKRLQRFPLAIQQSVAYIAGQRLVGHFRSQDYLEEYVKRAEDLLKSDALRGTDKEYVINTFNTWQITIDKIASNEQHGQLALEVLDVIAYFAPDNINRDIFLSLAGGFEAKLKTAVRLLIRYSMVISHQKQSVLSVHRLVQQVTRIKLKNENREETIIGIAFKLLEENCQYGNDKREDFTKKKELLTHLETFLSHIEDWLKEEPLNKQAIEKNYLKKLLVLIISGYSDYSNPRRLIELCERALPIFDNHFGSDRIKINILETLGNAYGVLGNTYKQFELLEQVLEIKKTLYEYNDLEMGRTLTNISNYFRDLRDYQKQKELLECALPIIENHYGGGHFQIAIALGNLSNAYGALGKPQKQKELLEKALEIKENYYGRNHFEVVKTLSNLGNTYGDLGDHKKKKELLERALLILEKHYEGDHFQIAITLGNLGNAYGALGKPQKQKELLEKALKIEENYFGSDHFVVVKTLANLGITYGDLGDHKKKIELLEHALPILEGHYGRDNFQIAIILGNLGNAYGALGDHLKQKEFLERSLKIKENHFGPDHFEVVKTLENLGIAYGDLGDHKKKREMLEQALKIEEIHYEPIHFHVDIIEEKLCNAYGALGDHPKQKEFLERSLKIKENHFGPDHFEVANTLKI